MKRLIIGLLLVLGVGIGTQVQAEEGTVTGISPVYVLVVPGTLSQVLIELETGTGGTSSTGTITVSEGETVTVTGRIFDSAGNPTEYAIRTWEGWPGTTISLREFFYKLEIPGGSPTTIEGRIGTTSPGIYCIATFLSQGVYHGTATVEEKGPVNIGCPPLSQPVLILATTTVQKGFVVEVKGATLTTLRVVPEMVVGTVGTSWWTYIVWGYNEAGGTHSIPASAVKWSSNVGTFSPSEGATMTTFYPGTTARTGTISASVGNLKGVGTITLGPDVISHIFAFATSATVAEGETLKIMATSTDKWGNIRDDIFSWTASEGTVTPSVGSWTTFTPIAAGTKTITASKDGVVGTLSVLVVAQRVLSRLGLNFTYGTIAAGGSLTIVCTGYDKDNVEIQIPGTVTFSTNVGTLAITAMNVAILFATTTVGTGNITATYGTFTAMGTLNVVSDNYHHVRVEVKSLILIAGVWSGEIPAYAEDEFNNSTWFEEENGTCTGYFAGPGGDISTFPPPGDKLWFPGKVSFVSSFICKGTALRQDPNNPTTLNIVVVNRQIRKN